MKKLGHLYYGISCIMDLANCFFIALNLLLYLVGWGLFYIVWDLERNTSWWYGIRRTALHDRHIIASASLLIVMLRLLSPVNSLAVQWVGLLAFTAEGAGSILGWGTKIPQAAQCNQKKKKINQNKLKYIGKHILTLFLWLSEMSRRVGHDWTTEQQHTDISINPEIHQK